jgi:hypothetical protein
MELIKHEEVASVTLLDLRLSEGKLMVYENCIEFVLNNCPEKNYMTSLDVKIGKS